MLFVKGWSEIISELAVTVTNVFVFQIARFDSLNRVPSIHKNQCHSAPKQLSMTITRS